MSVGQHFQGHGLGLGLGLDLDLDIDGYLDDLDVHVVARAFRVPDHGVDDPLDAILSGRPASVLSG